MRSAYADVAAVGVVCIECLCFSDMVWCHKLFTVAVEGEYRIPVYFILGNILPFR